MKKILRIVVLVVVAAVAYYKKSASDGQPHPSTTDAATEVSSDSDSLSGGATSNANRPRIELPQGGSSSESESRPKANKPESTPEPEARTGGFDVRGESAILNAFKARRSDVQINYTGPVVYVLPYDNDPPRHQNWLMELSNGHTIKVSHNTDLAPKIPTLKKGDRVTVYGEYEFNEKGGVIHWTHHDPDGRHIGGFIRHNGQKYE